MAGDREKAFLAGLGTGALGGFAGHISESRRRKAKELKEAERLREKAARALWEYEQESTQPLIGAGGDPAQVQDIRRELERYVRENNQEILDVELGGLMRDMPQSSYRDPMSQNLGGAVRMTEDQLSSIQRELEQAQEALATQKGTVQGMGRRQAEADRVMNAQDIARLTNQMAGTDVSVFDDALAPQAQGVDADKYGAAVTERERIQNRVSQLKDQLEATQKQRGTVAKAAQKYGSDVNVPGAGFDPQVQMRSQEASELGTMAAARRQLNALGIDQQMTGQAASAYRIAMDRTAPLEEQAQAWMALRDSFGIVLPEAVEIYLQGLGVPSTDIMGDRMPPQFGASPAAPQFGAPQGGGMQGGGGWDLADQRRRNEWDLADEQRRRWAESLQ